MNITTEYTEYIEGLPLRQHRFEFSASRRMIPK